MYHNDGDNESILASPSLDQVERSTVGLRGASFLKVVLLEWDLRGH